MKKVLILLIRFYKTAINPYLGANCRFHPSCSEYAIQALNKYGVFKGCWLSLKRLFKCGPWHPGGWDEP